jgi:hypothetical protein
MAKRTGNTTEAAGALGKHLARHRTASGQAFWQSGNAGFSWGQQGIPSAMDAVSDISAMDASSIGTALDRITIEAVRRLTIVRIESKRERSDQICTWATSHIMADMSTRGTFPPCRGGTYLFTGFVGICARHVQRLAFGPPW